MHSDCGLQLWNFGAYYYLWALATLAV
jgi:hypothetical protein